MKDKMPLQQLVPSLHEEFMDGNFVVRKSAQVFLTIARDQAHEQMKTKTKGISGVIEITDYPTSSSR